MTIYGHQPLVISDLYFEVRNAIAHLFFLCMYLVEKERIASVSPTAILFYGFKPYIPVSFSRACCRRFHRSGAIRLHRYGKLQM